MRRLRFVVAISALAFAAVAGADANIGSTATQAAQMYATECGACHLDYPAKLLSPIEWGQVLGQLDRHYGVDASLDAGAADAVARHVRAQSSPSTPGATTLPRITSKHWFREEHDEIGSRVFQSEAVKSPSNCSACHLAAEHGDFEEHSIRIPR
jgi:hypothetical protein